MKVNGIKMEGPRIVELCFLINGGSAVQFRFRPLRDNEDFELTMPKPTPPVRVAPGGVKHFNTEDKSYKKALAAWVEYKLDWELLKSIDATEGLEWETVDPAKAETWKNWRDEVTKNFGAAVTNKLFGGYMEAQYITEEGMEKARNAFLTGLREQQEKSLLLPEGQENTQSTEPVKD